MRLTMILCTLVAFSSVTRGDVLIEGSTVEFVGPGEYTFDFTVTAIGAETIVGFTMPLINANSSTPVAEVPDTSLSDIEFTPNPLLESKAASSDFTLNGFGFSISADDGNVSPIVLNNGESTLLFSIPMNVVAPGNVLEENVILSNLLSITSPQATNIPVAGFSPAVANVSLVPEPSGLAVCSVGVVGAIARRRRR